MFSRLAAIVLEPDARLATGLLLAVVALLPAEPLHHVPLIALAMLGAVRLVAGRAQLGSLESRFLVVVFLCMWLPMLASLPDAVNPAESIRKAASLCIYFLSGVYAVGAYSRFRELDWVMVGVTIILVFWCLDALWQFLVGADWFGVPYEGGRLPGPFRVGRIGNVLAGFAPLFFESVRRTRRYWRWSPVLVAPYLLVIVLSGTRAAWGVLVVVTIGYLLFLIRWSDRSSSGGPRWNLGRIAAVSPAIILAVALSGYTWPGEAERVGKVVAERVEPLSGLWSGDREKFEIAVRFRLSIWETAANMWSAHWLNGVGPRGFRYAYDQYNPEHDYFLALGGTRGAAKDPHMQLLEIAAETGVFGLLGYVVLVVVFFAKLLRLERRSLISVYPYALTLIVALFPFNGHLSFYSALSAGLIWFVVIINASAFAITSREESKSHAGQSKDI